MSLLSGEKATPLWPLFCWFNAMERISVPLDGSQKRSAVLTMLLAMSKSSPIVTRSLPSGEYCSTEMPPKMTPLLPGPPKVRTSLPWVQS